MIQPKQGWHRGRKILRTVGVLFLLMNGMAALHAYRFTHFQPEIATRQAPGSLSWSQKVKAVLTGAPNPRPENTRVPEGAYQTITLGGTYPTEGWLIEMSDARGTVIICHGYGASKSDMLDRADFFLQQSYDVLLIDLMGAGAAAGNQTTIGYKEAEQVAMAVRWVQERNRQPVILFGTSMGAVAIMRYCAITPRPIIAATILECPFGSLQQTVSARFSVMGLPSFPMAALLVYWGGVENGFNAFKHRPVDYARSMIMPVLLLQGDRDPYVSLKEAKAIYRRLPAQKELRIMAGAGHENYRNYDTSGWETAITGFLSRIRSN